VELEEQVLLPHLVHQEQLIEVVEEEVQEVELDQEDQEILDWEVLVDLVLLL
jgi:hypothetical protein